MSVFMHKDGTEHITETTSIQKDDTDSLVPDSDRAPRSRPRVPSFLRPTENDEIGYFAPRTWEFWRALITCFCLMCLIGHLLEIPYCMIMDSLFGIVDDSYAVWTDPWFHPYWVYGFGAAAMTLLLEPWKERLVVRNSSLPVALLKCFLSVVAIACILELVIGLLVNQPDPATGLYPYWDNSHLPGNVFGQAWIVNDIAIGIGAMVYLWIVYPLVCRLYLKLRPQVANFVFTIIVAGFGACCMLSYGTLISWGVL